MGLIKEALIISNEEKEIESKCFFRLHSLQDIMKANVMSKRSFYLFDGIGKGILCQVAKEAYSLCFTSHYYDSSSYGHECPPAACPILLCQSNDPPDRPSLDEIHHERRRSLVVLQKGQMLPYEGIKMMICIKYDKLQVKNALYTQLGKYQKQGDFLVQNLKHPFIYRYTKITPALQQTWPFTKSHQCLYI